MGALYRSLYRLGFTPWDTPHIPGPLLRTVEGPPPLPPGRAVDLGCGTGHQARYLAARGWTVTAVDDAREALARSRPTPGITWRRADVTAPDEVDPDRRLAGTVSLVLDNGCLHGIPAARRPGWAATVRALAAPGCVLLVRAIARRSGIGPAGLARGELGRLLGPGWQEEPEPEAGWSRWRRLDGP